MQNIFDALFSFSFLCKDPSIIAHCLTFRSFYKGKLCKNCLVFAWNPTTYQNRPATKEEFHYEYQCIVLNRTLVIFFFLKIKARLWSYRFYLCWRPCSQYIIKLDSGYVPLLFTNFVFSVIVIPILAPLDLKS